MKFIMTNLMSLMKHLNQFRCMFHPALKNVKNKLQILFFILLLFLLTTSLFAEQRTSISQYGITWYFDGSYECGQFVTGDWWVVGPVTINSVSPGQTQGRNGSCLNPMGGRQGYDDRPAGSSYSTADRVSYPCILQPNSSIVSSVSKATVPEYFNGPMTDQAVLTVVSAPIADGTFRPGFCGTYKKYFTTSQVNMSILPNVPVPASAPPASEIIKVTERPRVTHINNARMSNACAENNWYNMPVTQYDYACYGRFHGRSVSRAAMYAMLNTPEKAEIVNNIIQWGIDNYAALRAGARWAADGGHFNGRKFPIVFAAVMLNDPDMLNIGVDYSGDGYFGEDDHTYYGATGNALWGKDGLPATYFLKGCTNFQSGDGAKDVRDPAHLVDGCPDYRLAMTSPNWVGQTLATLFINGKDVWNHDAYFEYVDRWMTTDPQGGNAESTFIRELWDLYRDNLPGPGGDPVPVTSVSISPSTLSLGIGLSSDLTENILPANATNKLVSWVSSNPSVATVDASSGLVTAYSEGTATITVTTNEGGFTDNCTVTVTPPSGEHNLAYGKTVSTTADDGTNIGDNLVDLELNTRWSAQNYPQSATVDFGEECNISRLEVSTYSDRAYQYVIEVSSDGTNFTQIIDRSSNTSSTQPITDLVSASGRYVKLTVTGASGYTGTWISILELAVIGTTGGATPVNPTSVSIAPISLDIEEGETAQLTEIVLPANATDKSVTWSSSNTSIATVNETSGLVTAVAEGNCAIIATTNVGGLTANCPVTVSEVPMPVAGTYYCDPVSGSMSNNGSEGSPWASLQAVFAAGKTFAADDIIYLMNGNHGNPVITNNNPGNVTITKYAGHNPELSTIKFNGATNWTLTNIKVTSNGAIVANQNIPLTHPVYPINDNTLVSTMSSDNITIDNCTVCSVDDNLVWTNDSLWNYHAWNGFLTTGGSNVSIINNQIKNVNYGSYGGSASGFIFRNNVVNNFCGDAIQISANYALIENNVLMNCYETNGNHDDLIQGTRNSPGYGVEIRGNKLFNTTDPSRLFVGEAQGIGMFDRMKNNYIVENNLVVVNHWHGITLLGATNCKVINNTVVDPDNTGIGPCWIQVAASLDGSDPASSGNIVRNNLCNSLNNDANIGTVDNNITVSYANYGTYFNDWADNDYTLKAGSPAIDAGTTASAPSIDIDGASRPQGSGYDVGCYEYSGAVINVTGVTLNPSSLNLQIGGSNSLTATVQPANATNKSVTWISGSPSVVSVDNGNLIALSEGTSTITVTTADGSFTDNCVVTVTVPVGDYNLALGKPVATTGDDGGHFGDNLVDDDVSDEARWSAEGFPQSAEIDLGVDCDITSLEVFTYQSRAYQYIIEGKADGGSYSTIVNRSSNTSTTQPITNNVSATARHIKLTVTGASGYTGSWISINELRVIGSVAPAVINVTSVSVAPTTLALDEGQTSDLTETVLPVDATDKSVEWLSSNPAVATVNITSGLVTAVNAGSAVITATTNDGGFTATCQVEVVAHVSSISLNETTLNLNVGETSDLDETVLPADAADKSVIYSSSNPSVATVNVTSGLVTAVDAGNAVITVTTNDGGYTATCNVTVVIPLENLALNKSVTVTEEDLPGTPGSNLVNGDIADAARWSADGFPQSAEIDLGANCDISSLQLYTYQSRAYQYTIEAKANGGSYSTVVNRSSNTSTAQPITDVVSVTARYVKITITGAAVYGGTWVSLNELEVYGVVSPVIEPTSVSLNQSSVSLDEGQTNQLVATVLPANADDKSVTYSSSNTSIAEVDTNTGLVTAVDAGSATITVTTNVGGFTANCNVTVIARVASVSLNQSSLSLEEGETADLDATVLPADAADKSVTYSSSSTSIATVDTNTGLVTAVAAGNANIIATTNDGGYTATCNVTVTAIAPVGENLALGKPVVADSEYNASYPAENAVDGNNTDNASRWLSANSSGNHWIEIDLEQNSTVNKVNFWTGYGGSYSFPIANYQIQYWNGSSWVNALDITSNTEAVVSHSLPNIETNKIRLYTSSAGSEIIRLYEIEVWGEIVQQQNFILNPVEDAYVRGGSYDTTNFGTASILYVKTHNTTEYTREAYLKFDLSSVSTVDNAYLRLYVNSLDGSSVHNVSFVGNDSWTEGGITYSSKPVATSQLNQFNVSTAGQYIEVDITTRVAAEAGGLLSLQIVSNNGQYIGYDSREGTNAPELVINDPSKSLLLAKHENYLGNSDLKFEIWPNPLSPEMNLNIEISGCKENQKAQLKIIDIMGKVVYTNKLITDGLGQAKSVCQLGTLRKGLYFISISNNDFCIKNKFIIK